MNLSRTLTFVTLIVAAGQLCAQEVRAPRIFLDKPLRIVQYQLKRLSNAQLMAVEKSDDDEKYAPVYSALLSRAGIARQEQEEAIAALAKIRQTSEADQIIKAISDLDFDQSQSQAVGAQLSRMLLSQPASELGKLADNFTEAIAGDSEFMRSVAFAGLIAGQQTEQAIEQAAKSDTAQEDLLRGIPMIPKAEARDGLIDHVTSMLDSAQSPVVQRAAINAVASIGKNQSATFASVASKISEPSLKNAAVKTLLSIPDAAREAKVSRSLVQMLVSQGEATPPAKRTTPAFLDSMQLADQLLSKLPVDEAREIRDRLSRVAVRVVQIHTVEEEMRYDVPFFAVQAGTEVQVVLKNEDLMPHNLVFTSPGKLQEIAEAGSKMGPEPGASGKQYVPESEDVLFATTMVQAHKQEALTFTAPSEPGEYPYVCTFPRHWMRMYGVMVVVEDLDAWLKNPVEPKDPIGSNRAFVQSWKVDDFTAELETALAGRNLDIGQRIFKEASCAQCHKMNGSGGAVGPELTKVFDKWKGDRAGVLREVLDPSHKIDPKYVVNVVITLDGRAVSGIVVEETKDNLSILNNPESGKPLVIPQDDIDEINKSAQSMMPKALMDRFTKDEVFELLHYLEKAGE